jgi:hypothetical protein
LDGSLPEFRASSMRGAGAFALLDDFVFDDNGVVRIPMRHWQSRRRMTEQRSVAGGCCRVTNCATSTRIM